MTADPLTPAEAVAIAAVIEGPDMTPLTWRCLTPGCTATGTTNAGAERHTKELRHVTTTEVRA